MPETWVKIVTTDWVGQQEEEGQGQILQDH